jgi:hypothetical protein
MKTIEQFEIGKGTSFTRADTKLPKNSVIPSEVDPFVHERINVVEGSVVSAPQALGRRTGENQLPAKAGSSMILGLAKPIQCHVRNDSD